MITRWPACTWLIDYMFCTRMAAATAAVSIHSIWPCTWSSVCSRLDTKMQLSCMQIGGTGDTNIWFIVFATDFTDQWILSLFNPHMLLIFHANTLIWSTSSLHPFEIQQTYLFSCILSFCASPSQSMNVNCKATNENAHAHSVHARNMKWNWKKFDQNEWNRV